MKYVIQWNLAYPDPEYPETSLSVRTFRGNGFAHCIYIRMSGNLHFSVLNYGHQTTDACVKMSRKSGIPLMIALLMVVLDRIFINNMHIIYIYTKFMKSS